mgnify:CR=1 FL=1
MTIRFQEDQRGRVICGHARFSLLGDRMARLEYAPGARFDDRPTFRALTLPEAVPFASTTTDDRKLVIEADGLRIEYEPDRPFAAENLRVFWSGGGVEGQWKPGDIDPDNLGATLTMDHVTRSIRARGVHPAGIRENERQGEVNLVTTAIDALNVVTSDPALAAFAAGLDVSNLFQALSLYEDYEALPDKLRAVLKGWLKFPPGPVSRAGYWVLDETGMAFYDPATAWIDRRLRPDYQNLFFLAYGRDYFKAMQQFISLCGRPPLIPRWAFGAWYSCWQDYTDAQNKEIVAAFEAQGIPLDVLIIDMDWHVNGWNGWDWNTELYPDLKGFFAWKEQAGVKVGLNLHDENINRQDTHFRRIAERLGIPEDAPSPDHPRLLPAPDSWTLDFTDRNVWEAVRDICYAPNERLGVDFWWLDSWQGYQDGYNSVLWKNHLATTHLAGQGKRPIILGRYSGIGSHRYPAYFSGDTASHWEVLDYELEVNVRAGQVGMNYFSHDLGGFKGPDPDTMIPLVDPELYVRWVQMGALSPVMRVHSNHGTREPWKYGERVLEIAREAYHLHHRLVPYLYHLAREAHDTGAPVHIPLYFLFPEDGKAYETTDQYFVGRRLMAAPVAAPGGRRKVYIPAGTYYALPDGDRLTGPLTLERTFPLRRIPLYVRAGSIIPMQPVSRRVGTALPDPLILAIYPGGEDRLAFYEDDGSTDAYLAGQFTRWPIQLTSAGNTVSVRLEPVQGTFDGAPDVRRVWVEIYFAGKPDRVTFDGEAISEGEAEPGWRYDDGARCVEIRLPPVQVSQLHALSAVFDAL